MSGFSYEKIETVNIQLTDGSTWECTVDGRGFVKPLRQVKPPIKPPTTISPAPTFMPAPKMMIGGSRMAIWDGETGTYIGIPSPPPSSPTPQPPDIEPPLIPDDPVFKARLRSIMTDNKYDRRVSHRKRGKLDMHHLWRAETGATNLFTQKDARKNKQYNVILCVDESGSMWKDRILKAAELAVFLAKAFEGINIDLAIVGFNTYIMTHKGFDEPIKDYNLLYNTIVANSHAPGCGCNNDYDALSKSYKMFKGRKGKNLVIFTSDGEPAPSGGFTQYKKDPVKYGSSYTQYTDKMGKTHSLWFDVDHDGSRTDIKEFHRLVESNKQLAATIGVGIQNDCWQCPVNIREDSLDKLKPVILDQIRRQIKRG